MLGESSAAWTPDTVGLPLFRLRLDQPFVR